MIYIQNEDLELLDQPKYCFNLYNETFLFFLLTCINSTLKSP